MVSATKMLIGVGVTNENTGFFFTGPLLQFLDTGQVGTAGTVTVGEWTFNVEENRLNPRQLDFLDKPFRKWILVKVTVHNFSRYAHLYEIPHPDNRGRLILNCFKGEPMGIASKCGDHVLVMIHGDNVEAIQRKAKKSMFGGSVKLTGDVTLSVRSTSEPQVLVNVDISTMGDSDEARKLSGYVARCASAGSGVTREWPTDVAPGVQRLEFS